MSIPIIICITLCILYTVMIAAMITGWLRTPGKMLLMPLPEEKISVIIIARNEAKGIARCLESLSVQDLPRDRYEVIIIDDGSEDETFHIASGFASEHVRILKLPAAISRNHKKAGIHFAMQHAKNELIALTDADCIAPEGWLSAISSCYRHYGSRMILGPVDFIPENGIVQKMLSLEFSSLIASAASFAGLGMPVLANGANLSFRKSDYQKISESLEKDAASGDDVFLLHRIKKEYGSGSIHFLRSASAIIRTSAPQTPADFLRQRIRWVKKTGGYRDPASIAVSMLIFAFNAFLLTSLILAICGASAWLVPAVFFFSRTVADAIFFSVYLHFTKRRMLLLWLIPTEILNMFYVVFIVILARIIPSFDWKGRPVRK